MPATCIICTEEPVATVMVACGHMCYCEACKPPTQSDCPACRVRGECIKTFVAGFDDDEPEPEQQQQQQPEPEQQQLPEWRVHHRAGTSDTVYHTSAPPPQAPKWNMVPWLMQPDAPRLVDYDAQDRYSYHTRHMQQGGPPVRDELFMTVPCPEDGEDMSAGDGMQQMPPQMIMYRNIPAPGPVSQGPNRRSRRRFGKSYGSTESESVHMKKRDERNRTRGTCYERASASASARSDDNDATRRQLDAFYAIPDDTPLSEKAQAQHEKNKRLAYETLASGYTTQDSAFVVGKQARCLMAKTTGAVQLSALRKIVEVTEHSVKLGGTRKEILASKTQTFVKI